MFVDSSTTRLNGKAYPRHLLREVLLRSRQGQAPHDRQPLRIARRRKWRRSGSRSGTRRTWPGWSRRRPRGRWSWSKVLGGGGLAVVATGPRPRHRRRPGLGSAGQAGAVASHRARSGPGLAPLGGAAGGRPRGGRGARHDQLRRRRSLRQSRLAGATSGGYRDPVVCSAKAGVGAGCVSLRRDQHLSWKASRTPSPPSATTGIASRASARS